MARFPVRSFRALRHLRDRQGPVRIGPGSRGQRATRRRPTRRRAQVERRGARFAMPDRLSWRIADPVGQGGPGPPAPGARPHRHRRSVRTRHRGIHLGGRTRPLSARRPGGRRGRPDDQLQAPRPGPVGDTQKGMTAREMTRSSRMSDRSRALALLAGVIALIAASVVVALYDQNQTVARDRAGAEVQARVLADTVTAALSFGDRAALREYVGALRANRGLDAVGVYDGRGRLVAGFTRSRLAPNLADTLTPATAGGRIIVHAPVAQNGERLGTVYLRDRSEPLARRLGRYVAPGFLVVMALLMFLITSLDARRLRRANRALETQIAEREKAEAALRQSQKMESIGRLTGGFAHEAMAAADRAADLTRRLLAFSRLQPLKPTSADIARTVNHISGLLRPTLGETITVETVVAGGLWRAHIDLSQLETAIVNLAINARDAMPRGGSLTIETANTYLDRAYAEGELEITPGQYVMVAITDTGAGIPPELLAQVFEPFFTTKPVGAGTGLGLSQVHGFIKQSGGHLRLYSEVGVGTTVKLYLPRSLTDAEQPKPAVARARPGDRRDLTVLVVEDEAGVREFATEALTELGFDVLSADGAGPALEILDAHPEIALMLTDVIMPETNGRMLAQEALHRRPSLRVVFMTGYTRNAIVHNGTLDADTHLVTKPFTIAELGAELEAVLAGSG